MVSDESDETELATSMTTTFNIHNLLNSNDGHDHFTPVVEQIMGREKENMEAVKRLRDMITKERKRCIEMKFALQTKIQKSEIVARENEAVRDGLNDALNELRILALKRSTTYERLENEPRFDDQEDYDPILNKLKRIMNDLTADIRRKEDYLTQHPPEKGNRDRDQAVSLDEMHKELDNYRQLLEDLIKLEKQWLNRLATMIKEHVKIDSDTKLSNFQKGVMRIIDLIDECLALELALDKLKAKKKELDAQRTLHEIVARRLHERKPLDFLPSKIRREFEQIAKRRGEKTESLPAVDQDLAKDLQTLYNWGFKEYKRGEQFLKDMARQVADAKAKMELDEKTRKLNRNLKSEQLQKAAVELAKSDAENKNLRKQLEQKRQGMDISSDKTRQISTDIKLLLEANKMRDASMGKTRDRVEKDIDIENEKRRQNEFAIDKLDRTKARQEDEMRKLDQQIRELKRKDGREPKRQKSEDRLEHLRREREDLKRKLVNSGKPKHAKRPSKQLNDTQKRRVDKTEESLQNKNKQLNDIERDSDELRRRMKQYETEMNAIKTDLDRKLSTNATLQRRLEEENARLANLKDALKKEQELSMKSNRKQIDNRLPSSPVLIENKYETFFSTPGPKSS